MKFLCDEMLKDVAKWLRAAGYDVAVSADGTNDRRLLERASIEQRLLLTRDRKITEHKSAKGRVLLLKCAELEACVRHLSETLAVDWLNRPFSRCLACNTLLIEVAGVGQLIPEKVSRSGKLIVACPACEQHFWEGTHVEKMRQRLERWARNSSPAR